MRVDLWNAGEEIASFEIATTSEHDLDGLEYEATLAFARKVLEQNEEANHLIGEAADAEVHVFDDHDEIVYAFINHQQTAAADYPVEVVE